MRRTIPAWAWMICSSFTMPDTIPLLPNAFFLCMYSRPRRCDLTKKGTEREFDGWAILGGFLDRVNSDEFDVGNRHPLGLQEQVAEILIPATTIDQHPNVPIDGLDYAKADMGLAVIRDAVQVLQQHLGELLERNQPLPLQLLHPLVQVVEHGPSVAVSP